MGLEWDVTSSPTKHLFRDISERKVGREGTLVRYGLLGMVLLLDMGYGLGTSFVPRLSERDSSLSTKEAGYMADWQYLPS